MDWNDNQPIFRQLSERISEQILQGVWLEETPLKALDHGERRERSVPILLKRVAAQLSEGGRIGLGIVGTLAPVSFSRDLFAAGLGDEPREPLNELVRFSILLRNPLGYGRYVVSHALIHTWALKIYSET